MNFIEAVERFLLLVEKVNAGTTGRSENDLSANLANCLRGLGLFPVLDTHVSTGARKRPDILAYVRAEDADVVVAAEIAIESKKPQELAAYETITDALCSGWFWREKTVPYITENITRIQYFALTTFTAFAIVRITDELRRAFIEYDVQRDEIVSKAVRANTTAFGCLPHGEQRAWQSWIKSHFSPAQLAPLPISTIVSARNIHSTDDLERFANELATVTAGTPEESRSGLFESVIGRIPCRYESLEGFIKRDLHLFLMIQHPGMSLAAVERFAKEHPDTVVAEFVAASIHSLIGRLFALKVIEDKFCVQEREPLIPPDFWIFRSNRYDGSSSEQIRDQVFRSLRELKNSGNMSVQRFAEYGFFFDWIEQYIDPILFRTFFEMIAGCNFEHLKGDLLGRFFELYAQRVNRMKRRALGQYYTPQPIVEFKWALVSAITRERRVANMMSVLDPGMGSGTFLSQGARVLAKNGIPRFWEHLAGFDISAQVLGIAYVNLYVAILGQLNRREAEQVGDLQVYATDALDPRNGQYLKQILPLIPDEDHKHFVEERIRISAEVKQSGKFTVVIGNPPYRNNSNRTLSQVASVFPTLLESSVSNARAQEINPRDDYAWFFAAADFYVQQSGVIAFIVSDSFVQKRGYKYFRRDLLRHYQIRHLVRLGGQVFLDVGPRIEFAIIVLEKRKEALSVPDETRLHPYIDLRPLAQSASQNELGTELDPRFQLMQAFARGDRQLPQPTPVSPREALNYSLYPLSPIIDRVQSDSLPLFEKKQRRIFVSKWPGLVTAFDELFKAKTRESLNARMSSFFQTCHTPRASERALTAAVEKWGAENGIGEDKHERLCQLAVQIRHKGISFDAANAKRALDGAMPNSARWYPPRANQVFIYYETGLDIPRNENEGRFVGWGTMQQWREPLSHTITPKLIYTTAAKPQYGLKAFVVDDEWYVKKHGGTSQQYNYTGLMNPLQPHRIDSLPNNLTDAGLDLLALLRNGGLPDGALHFFVAAIYNSEIAAEFLDQVSSASPFAIRVPRESQLKLVSELAEKAKYMRDLYWLVYLAEGREEIECSELSQIDESLLKSVGLQKETIRSRQFRDRNIYKVPNDLKEHVQEQADEIQEQLDHLATHLYD